MDPEDSGALFQLRYQFIRYHYYRFFYSRFPPTSSIVLALEIGFVETLLKLGSDRDGILEDRQSTELNRILY